MCFKGALNKAKVASHKVIKCSIGFQNELLSDAFSRDKTETVSHALYCHLISSKHEMFAL
jgi:hypothetical protein